MLHLLEFSNSTISILRDQEPKNNFKWHDMVYVLSPLSIIQKLVGFVNNIITKWEAIIPK